MLLHTSRLFQFPRETCFFAVFPKINQSLKRKKSKLNRFKQKSFFSVSHLGFSFFFLSLETMEPHLPDEKLGIKIASLMLSAEAAAYLFSLSPLFILSLCSLQSSWMCLAFLQAIFPALFARGTKRLGRNRTLMCRPVHFLSNLSDKGQCDH